MNRNISNRIFISFIKNGQNVHGQLTSTRTLSQGWDPDRGVAVPDWRVMSNQPKVFLPLYEGSTVIPASDLQDVAWTYDGETLTFDGSGNCTNKTYTKTVGGQTQTVPLFIRTTHRLSGSTVDMPALTVNGNIAAAGDATLHHIGISGKVSLGGVAAGFSDTIPVTVATLNSSGYMAVLEFEGGKTTLDGDTDYVRARAKLFTAAGQYKGQWTPSFELNEDPVVTSGGMVTVNPDGDTITIYGRAVTDAAVLTLNAKIDGETVATAIHVIDDIGDPEYLWIQYSVDSGDAENDSPDVSLHEGQSVTYTMWVARNDDIEAVNAAFGTFEFQPRKADGELLTAAECTAVGLTGTRDGDGFVDITASVSTPDGQAVTGGMITIAHSEAARAVFGVQASGIVRARAAVS